MKSVIISVVIAAAIVVGSLIYTRNLENVSEELTVMNERVIDCIMVDDYSGAGTEIERLSAYLNRKRVMLDATGNHDEIDKIEMNISELEEFSRGQKKTDALSKCHVLDFLFKHLPMDYELKLENIL